MIAYMRDFGLILCTSAVVVGLFGSVTPNKASGRTVRAVLGLYMALVLVSPFVRGDVALEWPSLQPVETPQPAEAAAQTDVLLADEIARRADEGLRELMTARLGISPHAVTTQINIDETGRIYCDMVAIELDEKDRERESEIRALADENLAAPVDFTYR